MNSFGNGIMMMGDMPMLSGTWYNPKTGDNFTVRDCYLEDNGIKVLTTDGRMLDYNIIQNYVQSDKPISKQPKVDAPKKSTNNSAPKTNITAGLEKSSIPESINDILTPEDQVLLGYTSPDLIDAPHAPAAKTTASVPKPKAELKNADIIAKGFKKAETPLIDVKLYWAAFPEKELNALTEIMEIPVEDIIDWMTEEYFKFEDLKESIAKYIKHVIEFGYNKDVFKASSAVEIPANLCDNKEYEEVLNKLNANIEELNKSKEEVKTLKDELKKSRDEAKTLKSELKNSKNEIKQLNKAIKNNQ